MSNGVEKPTSTAKASATTVPTITVQPTGAAASQVTGNAMPGSDSENLNTARSAWVLAGLLFICIGLGCYRMIFVKQRDYFRRKNSKSEVLADLIAYVPDESSRAWPHIVAGVTGCIGFCLICGSVFAFPFSRSSESFQGMAASAAGVSFSILISGISFWTLYQTKRIAHENGYKIANFTELVDELTRELGRLQEDFLTTHNQRAVAHHRVFVITTNPFFGILSYPTSDFTTKYRLALHGIADCVKSSLNYNQIHNHVQGADFCFEIICGDNEALLEFHTNFYGNTPDAANRAQQTTNLVEQEIQHIQQAAGNQIIFTRVRQIPPTQFMVIGNLLYEFTLETAEGRSEIYDTDVKEERRACDRFAQTFRVLKQLR